MIVWDIVLNTVHTLYFVALSIHNSFCFSTAMKSTFHSELIKIKVV